MTTTARWKIPAALLSTWFIWGSTYLAIKFALVSFPPFFQTGTRFLTAGSILLLWQRSRGAPMPSLKEWRNALIVGSLMLGGGTGGTAVAEQTLGSGLTVAFIASLPLVIAAFNRLWGVKTTRLENAGILIGFIGVLMLTQGASFLASPIGVLAVSTAVVGWSLGSVLSQRALPLAPGATGFASEMLCGGAFLCALSLLTHEQPHFPPDPLALASWLYLIVFGSLIAFNAYMYLLGNTAASLASSYSYVNPVIAMLLGIFIAGETVTAYEGMATGVILTSVIFLLWARRQASTAAARSGQR